MAATRLSADGRRTLLTDLERLKSDADDLWAPDQVLRRFLPLPLHDRVFDPHVMVVRGARGSGKSMLFHTLRALRERSLPVTTLFPRAQVAEPVWIEGFAETSVSHPSTVVLEGFVRQADDAALRLFWTMHLIGRLLEEASTQPSFDGSPFKPWKDARNDVWLWVNAGRAAMPAFATFLDQFDAYARTHGQTWCVTYDHLDKIGLDDREVRVRATSALLALWLSLGNRYRNLRPKVFVREDLFEQSAHRSADASKLHGRSISLSWDGQALYRLLIRHMAAESDALAGWVRQGGIPLVENTHFGWLPPSHLPEEGDVSQSGFAEHLVGRQMGRGVTAGLAHRWILARLQDAHQRIAPRSLLSLVATAAAHALEHGPQGTEDHLLHPDELRGALDGTSKRHVAQMAEEHRVIRRLENLRGAALLFDRDDVVERLAAPRPGVVDGFGDDGAWVLDELLRIGVMRFRDDGRLDVPDIYRLAFGIKRQGGAARVMRRV